MIIARTIKQAGSFLARIRKEKMSVGLVPTMGALHRGHLSLIECCRSENAVTVVSIFVNPTQFNDPKDLKNYPRNLEKDISRLKESGCDMLFVPATRTIYPRPDLRIFDFGGLEHRMEGQFRPGHFNGVAQVVSRLFDIIKPDRAYFGKKDIQQLAIIRKLTAMQNSDVEIRACETLREDDGLAMSSRNVLLSAEQRENAAIINQTLREAVRKRGMTVDELKSWVADVINKNPLFELEYFEIVNSSDLQPVTDWAGGEDELVACIAVRTSQIRLIDNVFFHNFASL